MTELENLIITMQDGLSTIETQFNLIINDILTGVSSLGEFKNVFTSLLDSGINIDYSVYGEALIDLGSKFSNCEDEIKEF
jgi:hypothetical protein